jgi:hypothetical protein
MSLFGGHPRAPGFGARLPRGLAVAAVAAVTVVPLAASAAAAAPAPPAAFSVYGSAAPLVWADSSSVPVGSLHVPFVAGSTQNLGLAGSSAFLAVPDKTNKTLSGDAINGLQCAGYKDEFCKDPFTATAKAEHKGPDAGHSEQAASFTGKDGKFPGSIRAMTDCPGDCATQLVRSVGSGAAPAGVLPGYVSVGASSATHDLSIDDKGRLVSTARSELDNVSIGPKNEVHFSSLVATAQAIGSGAENSKDGRADLRINDFYILDNQVELTRAGLRLANAGPSEQEAYDGAKVLLKKLRDRGITLALPNFDAQLTRTPDHVTVDTQGLSVYFEQSVGSVQAAALSDPLQLGHATAVVAALDAGHVEVKQDSKGNPVVVTTAPTSAPAAPPGPARPKPPNPAPGPRNSLVPGPGHNNGPLGANGNPNPPSNRGTVSSPGPNPGPSTPSPSVEPGESPTADNNPALNDPSQTALPSARDLANKLGLRDAHSVSRAFGAFLGLGLILPLSRFLIRRLG